jgi:hypothetical protein
MHFIEDIVNKGGENLEIMIVPTYFKVSKRYGGFEDDEDFFELIVHRNKHLIRYKTKNTNKNFTEEYNYVTILNKFIYLKDILKYFYPDDVEGTTDVRDSVNTDIRDSSLNDLLT